MTTSILRSLENLSTGYTVFEQNQVLTAFELNTVSVYLDEQDRLTRIGLIGVGIVCGLRLSRGNARVRLSKGLAITTDGDLLYLPGDMVYDRFKLYDETRPKYGPLYVGEKMVKAFELVAEGKADPAALPLAQIPLGTGLGIESMVAVLLMESHQHDPDLCTGTDCDNLGMDLINLPRFLLVGPAEAGALGAKIPLLEDAARKLIPVIVERPVIPPDMSSLAQLNSLYRSTCQTALKRFRGALSNVGAVCVGFLGDTFATDPSPGWLPILDKLGATLGDELQGFQYVYDFLKDLAETHNAFVDTLFGDNVVCCPDILAFPKHVIVEGTAERALSRTPFFPSPATLGTTDKRAQAIFLARKLHAMIASFEVPSDASTPIRITPSAGEIRPLEQRAIPWYYKFVRERPIHQSWNQSLSARAMESRNYSYNAASWGGDAAALNPLRAQIGHLDFFRIEGHIGKGAAAVVKTLESQISENNLPIAVQAVFLGSDPTKVVIKPPLRYTDLHRFHYLLRNEVAQQVEEAREFTGKFTLQVKKAVADKVISDADNHGNSIETAATQKGRVMEETASRTAPKLRVPYQDYRKDAGKVWIEDIRNTVQAAGDFRAGLGQVTQSEFASPIDNLIGSSHVRWIDWIDNIIADKDKKDDEKLLLSKFMQRHPGLEHFAGVVKGGTFVLVYDVQNIVVADFMLPYRAVEAVEETPQEAPLPKSNFKPELLSEKAIKFAPYMDRSLLDRFVKERFTGFTAELAPLWKKDIDAQKEYFNVFKDTVKLTRDVLIKNDRVTSDPRELPAVTDPQLGLLMEDTRIREHRLELVRSQTLNPAVNPAESQKLIREAELEYAKSLINTTQYVATSKLDVNPGKDGHVALQYVSQGTNKLNDTEALNEVKMGFEKAGNVATPEAKKLIGNVIKIRGIR